MNNPKNPKERNLIKGALRRVFSRSDLRNEALLSTHIEHSDPERPRVTKWNWCTECGLIEASYLFDVDHVDPLIPLGKSLEDFEWADIVDRLWCDINNLKPVCKPCHREKSRLEMKERRRIKKGKKT